MAIQTPEQMDFSNKRFTLIISGSPDLGKTTLALSAPDPILVDLDNGISRVRAEHRKQASIVGTYEELLADMESPAYKAAESVVLDTGGSLIQLMQPWAKKQDPKAARDGRAMFGIVKREFDRLTHQIRTIDRKNCIIVFHTTEVQKGEIITARLSCEGSAKDIVWTPADFGCYMHMLGKKRVLGFTPTEEYFAKGSFGITGVQEVPDLQPGSPNDYLARLFDEARTNITQEMERYAPERHAYNEAMTAGASRIALIDSPEDANAAAAELGGMRHGLTSKAELLALLKQRVVEIGAVWNKEAKCYERAQDHGQSA